MFVLIHLKIKINVLFNYLNRKYNLVPPLGLDNGRDIKCIWVSETQANYHDYFQLSKKSTQQLYWNLCVKHRENNGT